jgi:hypothetical protein
MCETTDLQMLHTPSGVSFGLRGAQDGRPAPLLMHFGGALTDALTHPDYRLLCELLIAQGWRAASIDLPVHGSEVREGEASYDMTGWRARLERGEDLLGDFFRRGTAVLDHLIASGLADPARIAASGLSRGGFSALHFAAADGRPRWVGAIAPLTDMTLIREFQGAEYLPAARALAVHTLVERLTGKCVWICIGNDDRRVSTDSTISFTRQRRSPQADVELHVLNYDGHQSTAADHHALAAWMLAHVSPGVSAENPDLALP